MLGQKGLLNFFEANYLLSSVAKMQCVFHKKKFSQLKSDIRSCRCKNFSLKRASGLTGGGGGAPPGATSGMSGPSCSEDD